MTDSEKMHYLRGYNRAASWPDHRPPEPPNEIVAGLMRAGIKLRDQVDGFLATCDADDEIQNGPLGQALDGFDEAMTAIGKYLKEQAEETK